MTEYAQVQDMRSARAQVLAARFEQVNRAFITAVERCTDIQWHATIASEGRAVGVVAHHLAEGYSGAAGLIQQVASGQALPPITMDMINQGNAQHAAQHADATKPEVLDLLRRNGAAAANTIREL